MQAAEREQHDIEQSLDHIEQQQAVLAATLDSYEKSANEILGGSQGGGSRVMDTGPADTERDKKSRVSLFFPKWFHFTDVVLQLHASD